MPYTNNYYGYPPQQFNMPQQSPVLTRVRDEAEALNCPGAPGNTMFFIDENAQFIYSKTMDASQLDKPRFVKFARVPEPVQEPKPEIDLSVLATKDDLNMLREEVKSLIAENTPSARIDALLNQEV